MDAPILLPQPKQLRLLGGHADAARVSSVCDPAVPNQGYRLMVTPERVTITASTDAGAFYGRKTLEQLQRQYGTCVPCLEIDDSPDLPVRGAMIDISRDKIPTMDSLYRLIDLLAGFKINQLQFYVEGFSFRYSFLPDPPVPGDVWTPLTGEQVELLDRYAAERFIELVPNQNALGHMAPWLSLEQYRHLAECPEGFTAFGMPNPPATLNPLHQESLQLVARMIDDLRPHFTSGLFSVNLDEPFELGEGASKHEAERVGAHTLYLDYAARVHELLAARGSRMMMAGDMVTIYPDRLAQLPHDVIILDWGYEAFTPFNERAAALAEAGRSFYILPGTSTSMSLAGRTANMLENVDTAAHAAATHRAAGLMVTDWGDGGHWQYAPASYAGLAYAAANAWHVGGTGTDELAAALNTHVYADPAGRTAQLWMRLGEYTRFEDLSVANMTTTTLGLQFGLVPRAALYQMLDGVSAGVNQVGQAMLGTTPIPAAYLPENRAAYDYEGLVAHLADLEHEAATAAPQCDDAALIRDELLQSVRMVRLGAGLRRLIDSELTDDRVAPAILREQLRTVTAEHRRLWLARNREGGLAHSMGPLERLVAQLADLERNR